jgi:hypothetical protein
VEQLEDMDPPWKKYPDLPRTSIGWRMGYGQDYHQNFWKWFSSLDAVAQEAYCRDHPEPGGWAGFYRMIIDHP